MIFSKKPKKQTPPTHPHAMLDTWTICDVSNDAFLLYNFQLS